MRMDGEFVVNGRKELYTVFTIVNNPRNDSPVCIEPLQ